MLHLLSLRQDDILSFLDCHIGHKYEYNYFCSCDLRSRLRVHTFVSLPCLQHLIYLLLFLMFYGAEGVNLRVGNNGKSFSWKYDFFFLSFFFAWNHVISLFLSHGSSWYHRTFKQYQEILLKVPKVLPWYLLPLLDQYDSIWTWAKLRSLLCIIYVIDAQN